MRDCPRPVSSSIGVMSNCPITGTTSPDGLTSSTSSIQASPPVPEGFSMRNEISCGAVSVNTSRYAAGITLPSRSRSLLNCLQSIRAGRRGADEILALTVDRDHALLAAPVRPAVDQPAHALLASVFPCNWRRIFGLHPIADDPFARPVHDQAAGVMA